MLYRAVDRAIGFYTVSVPAENDVDFLNCLNKNNAVFRKPRASDSKLVVNISALSYKRAERAAVDAGVMLTVEKAVGVPFVIYKYRKRLGLVIGTLIGLVMIFLSTVFVWRIDVTGNTDIPTGRILAALAESGIETGTYIPTIRVNRAASKLILTLPDLSSASINITGNHIAVDVIERKRRPERIETDGCGNVVAACDGIIAAVEAYSGKPLVAAGDTVTKGQILIAGEYVTPRETVIVTRARGAVYAIVYRDFVITIPLAFQEKRFTGRTDSKTSYSIIGKEIKTFIGSPVSFMRCEIEATTEKLKLFFLELPIIKSGMTAREYVVETVNITEEEARQKALAAFNAWCESDIEGELAKRYYETAYDSVTETVTLTGSAEVIIDIAEEVAFDPFELQDYSESP